ncbi:MAG: ribulose-phosphate 3-epimerase [Spirochaetales bacterium]|nr:ribulose-phosphate 3-epimerase [Spirochaetales bacterium]
MERSIIIAPSVLSADFSDIRTALEDIRLSGTNWVHLDVMDGVFVPNITFGPKFISDIRPCSDLFFDTHLMIEEPVRFIEQFAKAGSDCITVHTEACEDIRETLDLIKSFGVECGLSIRPSTPVEEVEPYLDMVDLVLIMSVNPGFGGQELIPETLNKVKRLVEIRGDRDYFISIDGGVNASTITDVFSSGVDVAVAGSAFFSAKDKRSFVQKMSRGQGDLR